MHYDINELIDNALKKVYNKFIGKKIELGVYIFGISFLEKKIMNINEQPTEPLYKITVIIKEIYFDFELGEACITFDPITIDYNLVVSAWIRNTIEILD